MRPPETHIVLLGAGHAHVEVLRRFARQRPPGARLTLIAREPRTPYSGMLPGVIRGDYTASQAAIDLTPLAAASGARLVVGEAIALHLERRLVALAGQPTERFDLLSLDVGGAPDMPEHGGVPVKPIGRFLQQMIALEGSLPADAPVAVVGGGPAGCELALALARRWGGYFRLTLVAGGAEPLADAPPHARRIVRRALVEAGVALVSGVTATQMADGRLFLSDGSFLTAGAALWATGVVGPAFLAASGLGCDAAGCVRVDACLRSTTHDFVFAAGDCAALGEHPRPKAGVWAVRAGAPLTENLRRAVAGRPLARWVPQRTALAILGLGDGRAVAWRNGVSVSGRLIWRWKDHIDRRWMRRYDPPPAVLAPPG